MSDGFSFESAIRSAEDNMAKDKAAYELRIEFWKGYKCAMEEARRHGA